MTPTSRQVSENVVVLMHRLGINNKEIAELIGMDRMPLGNRILGKTEWKAYEVEALARALGVSMDEITGRIPDFKEWDRRRSDAAAQVGIRAAGGPRFLVMPEEAFDYLTPPSRLAKPTSDIMSFSSADHPSRTVPRTSRSLPRRHPARDRLFGAP